jgi:hypothetical protein
MTTASASQTVSRVLRFCRRVRGEYLRASGEHMLWRAMSTGDKDLGRELTVKATERIVDGCEIIRACENE